MPDEGLCLAYALYLAENGKLGESLNKLLFAIKTFNSPISVENIHPVVEKLAIIVQMEANNNNILTESARDIYSCPTCTGVLNEPVTIPCGHTFCKQCLLKDPTCRVCHHSLINPDVSVYRTNILISHLVNKWWGEELKGINLRTKADQLFQENHLHESLQLYNEAQKYAPDDYLLMSNRSHLLLSLGRKEDALEDAMRVVHKRPNWAKGHFRRAMALLSLGLEEESLVAMLLCASLENSNDLPTVIEEIAEMFIEIMSRATFPSFSHTPSGRIFHHSSSYSLSEEEYEEEEEEEEEKRIEEIEGGDAEAAPGMTSARSPLCVEQVPLNDSPVISRVISSLYSAMDNMKHSKHNIEKKIDPADVTRSDFECNLCYRYFWQPVTTPCGHTFCRSCLDRSLDHSVHCPLCKTSLRDHLADRECRTTEFIEKAMRHLLPREVEERQTQHEKELSEYANWGRDPQHEIPIFVATLAIPSVSCPLHVFEPRYRLMIRRCLEAGSKQFGMCVPSEGQDHGYANYGTLLEIKDVKYICDGRSVISTYGSRRFKCVIKGMKDGYHTSTVVFLEDDRVPASSVNSLLRLHDAVCTKARDWFSTIPCTTQKQILNYYGPMPPVEAEYWKLPDGPSWLWWLLAVLPVDSSVQLRILQETNLQIRLELIFRILRCVRIYQKNIS